VSALVEPDVDAVSDGLTAVARASMWSAWRSLRDSSALTRLRRRRDYALGRGGIPDLDDGASEELRDLAQISRLNMGGVVVKTFARGLSVVGFRSPTADDDEPAWRWWQQHRLDQRQSLVHRHTLTYGEGYVSVLPDDRYGDPARPVIWSPLSAVVDFAEADDLFPATAMLTRRTADGWSVLLVDDTYVQPGVIRLAPRDAGGETVDGVRVRDIEPTGEPWAHGATYNGAPVCPVVRFVDEWSDEATATSAQGVVEPIIDLNRAMNQVNFDRLVVARFGAHDQKLIIGWSAPKDRLARMSAGHIATIDEHPDDVRVERWQGSALEPYNALIREMREQVALEAAIPLWAAGNISNVSTDTAAMIEAAHQRELGVKRDSIGESWEQVVRLGVAMSGQEQPADDAEMVWRDTQARSFAQVVDGIVKLATIPAGSEGVPVEMMLDTIPGMSQQRITAIRDELRRRRSHARMDALIAAAPDAPSEPPPAPGREAAP